MIKLYIYSCVFLFLSLSCKETINPDKIVDCYPDIFPDYKEVTIPSTIAPLNFTVNGKFSKIDALIKGRNSGVIHIQDDDFVEIPTKDWQKLLQENIGDSLYITISVKQSEGWIQYKPFAIYVSDYPIDYGLVYRLIAPGYEVYSKMGIYQRNLSDFSEQSLIVNTVMPGSCVNCHSFSGNSPEQMSFHIRGKHGATVITSGGKSELYSTKTEKTIGSCVYPYWHPSNKYIAYSVNKTQQAFHEIKNKRVEVLDLASDIVVYNLETNELLSSPLLMSESVFETYPSFSPDGKTLYFCSADSRAIPQEYESIKYSLCSISFDPTKGAFGEKVDTLVSSIETNKSVSFPRPSFDGKYIMYTLSDYGNFSIWHQESDLWLFDIITKENRELKEVNSNDVDSYHSWSSNSKWFVFSSRRMDGLYTHPYIASINDKGEISKPFMLPQQKPDYYSKLLYSFNIPEFVTGPVSLDVRDIEQKAMSEKRIQFSYK